MAIYYIAQKYSLKLGNIVLLIFSLLFYIKGEKGLVLVMVLSSSIDYFIGAKIHSLQQISSETKSQQKSFLILSIILNLGILFYFKYCNFFIESAQIIMQGMGVNLSWNTLNITLPLGISFYTFQSMSYTIDIYRQQTHKCKSYWSFLSYVTLFPQLVAGPIVRYKDVEVELYNRKISYEDILEGLARFGFGLAKKVIIANQMGYFADAYFNQPAGDLDMLGAWIGITAYTFQIYFDFSGYSDMAIGLGRVFGFHFPENFNYPYQARSVQDFWHRWHISLSTWFRDYLYIPLGGNRYGKYRTIFNQYAVFFLCGLWHGASINFVIWGLFHGTLLFLERILRQRNIHLFKRGIGNIYTMVMVMIGWVYFRAETVGQANTYILKMFSFENLHPVSLATLNDRMYLIGFILGLLFCSRHLMSYLRRHQQLKYYMALILTLISSIILIEESSNPFIYFRF